MQPQECIDDTVLKPDEEGFFHLKDINISKNEEFENNKYSRAYDRIDNFTSFSTYQLDCRTENYLKKIIDTILKPQQDKIKKENLQVLIYTCLKELVINAHKANIKDYLITSNKLRYDSQEDQETVYKLMRSVLRDTNPELKAVNVEAHEKGKRIAIRFFPDDNTLILIVKNNTPLFPVEEKRIREKLAKANKFNSLIEYYMENADELEGQGIGLAMVHLMLKDTGMVNKDCKNFVIHSGKTNPEETIARIIFNLS